jgi:L-cysteine/cystine lyase
LNTGTAGPLPRRAAAAIAAAGERQLLGGRASWRPYIEEYFPLLADLRARFARLLGATAEEIALTHHTTEGMNIALWGLNWRAGDEIVTTTQEHPGALLPAYAVARRFGLGVRLVEVGAADDVVAAIAAALSPRTRLVVLDVRALGVDFYAVPGQKWLCGPEGVGALYVRRERLSDLAPTFMGFFSIRDEAALDLTGHFLPAAGAQRYEQDEQGTVYWPALFGMRESLRWLEEDVGWAWIYERTAAIAGRCRTLLGALPGVTLHTPASYAGLTTFSVAELEAEPAATRLADQGVIIRSIPHTNWLRVATGFFNTEADLESLRAGLLALGAPGA